MYVNDLEVVFLGIMEFLMMNSIMMGMSSKLLIFSRTLVWYLLTQGHSHKHRTLILARQGREAMFSL